MKEILLRDTPASDPAMCEGPLIRQVEGQDLFAREARYHLYCRKRLNEDYTNHIRAQNRAENSAYNENAQAHTHALNIPLEHVKSHVIQAGALISHDGWGDAGLLCLSHCDFPSLIQVVAVNARTLAKR